MCIVVHVRQVKMMMSVGLRTYGEVMMGEAVVRL